MLTPSQARRSYHTKANPKDKIPKKEKIETFRMLLLLLLLLMLMMMVGDGCHCAHEEPTTRGERLSNYTGNPWP